MLAGDVVNAAWALLKPELRSFGFSVSRRGADRRHEDGTVALIALQRSQSSTRDRAFLAVNYGVFSARFAADLASGPGKPCVEAAHWRTRARFANSKHRDGDDEWLVVEAGEDPRHLADALRRVFRGTVLPQLDAHSSGEALRDEWLAGISEGLTEVGRLLCVVVAVRALGPRERLPECIAALRANVAGTVHAAGVEYDLKRLGLSDAADPPS